MNELIPTAQAGGGGKREIFMPDGITRRCRSWFRNTGDQCPRTARFIIYYGCEHEHLGNGTACVPCADYLVTIMTAGNFSCGECGYPNWIIKMEPVDEPEEDVLIG